jgi:hypothetical protein
MGGTLGFKQEDMQLKVGWAALACAMKRRKHRERALEEHVPLLPLGLLAYPFGDECG